MFFDKFKKYKHIHMIGIGGISMSGLAEILVKWGYKVSGSDLKSSSTTEKLKKSGIEIHTPHNAKNIEGADVIIYTAAIKDNNPEFLRAKELNLPIIDRASFLGEITRMYSKTIAVSGTHGKTTTTSMISVAMTEANIDPTVLVGGEVEAIGGNYRIGNSEFLITEACEYVESFLKFYPHAAVLLNIESDHLDYFKDIDHIKSSFEKFTDRVPQDGVLIGNFDDPNVRNILEKASQNTVSFSLNSKKADWYLENLDISTHGCSKFDVINKNEYKGTIELNKPGIHNVYNALACISTCSYFGVKFKNIKASLKGFSGAKRRFEYKGTYNGITIIDDYAHHPSEVKVTLEAAAQQFHQTLWCIFQPHTYTRTKAFLNEFSTAFKSADKVIILDIYAAREANNGEVHSKDLVKAINNNTANAVYSPNFNEAAEIILKQARSGDLIITMGAGDVYKIGEMILKSNKAAV